MPGEVHLRQPLGVLVKPKAYSIVFEVKDRVKMLQEKISHQEHLAGVPRQVVLMDFQKAFLRTADEQVLARRYLKNVA